MQVLLWLLLFALFSMRLSLPPGFEINWVNLNFSPDWLHGWSSPWLVGAWTVALLLGIAGVWLFEAACRWFCGNIWLSDGDTAGFSGMGAEILGWWTLWILCGRHWGLDKLPENLLEFALYFVGIWASLNILRWIVRNVALSSGRRFVFTGGYRELLGYHILFLVSMLTIIGWAWVLAAMFRWMASNTASEDAVLEFHGEGFEVLWRTLGAILFCIPVVTIPWAWVWYTRWLVRTTTIEANVGQAPLPAHDFGS